MRIRSEDCAYIGDSTYDGVAAKAAGMRFIGSATGYTSKRELERHGAITVIRSMAELQKAKL